MNQVKGDPLLIFDFVDKSGHKKRRVFRDPIKIISTDTVNEVITSLEEVQSFVQKGYYAAGYVSYEASPAFDAAHTVLPDHKMPLVWFGIFADPDKCDEPDTEKKNGFTIGSWKSDTSREQYQDCIQKIKHAIACGDTYQVNYTMRLRSSFAGDDLAYYQSLLNLQQSNYSAYLNIGRFRILSLSPELFFSIKSSRSAAAQSVVENGQKDHFLVNGKTITTRPMKGTIQRGRWLREDKEFAAWLAASKKNQAENVMIVDLLRNDLSRIPGISSVQVPRLFEIESYPTVYQMTSTVTATVKNETTFVDVLKALFPCGSITGAPKISTMSLIAELEQNPREIYCGTIGVIEPNGDAMFNVAIRSVLIDSETGLAEYGVGGGITWDSTTDGEYAEAFTKAALLRESPKPFELLESLKLQHGEYVLLGRHLNRLTMSAKFFDIPIDLEVIKDKLQDHAISHGESTRKVRLLVSQHGEVRVESILLNELPSGVQGAKGVTGVKGLQNVQGAQTLKAVALANTPISKEDRFLYHKTTRRDVYTQHQKEHPNVYDVLLWNGDGQITEFTNGNIVLEMDSRKFTPPRDCGLLAGTFRAELLEQGMIKEKVLTRPDLERATRIWLINSVRGWVQVRFGENS